MFMWKQLNLLYSMINPKCTEHLLHSIIYILSIIPLIVYFLYIPYVLYTVSISVCGSIY